MKTLPDNKGREFVASKVALTINLNKMIQMERKWPLMVIWSHNENHRALVKVIV